MIYFVVSASLFLLITQFFSVQVQAQPLVVNPMFDVETVFSGSFEPSSMVFLGQDDILVLDRDEGKVFRVTDGIQSKPLLDVNVATDGYRGLLGITSVNNNSTYVFLYFTESATDDSSDKARHPVNPLGNRLYRYELIDNKLINPKAIIEFTCLAWSQRQWRSN